MLTIVFDIEIFVRVLAYLPDWRGFLGRGQNWLDLILAVGSTVIQIPVVHNSSVYPWLTIFQLTRFYRVILEIPRMKPLLVRAMLRRYGLSVSSELTLFVQLAVFGNMYGLANIPLFLLLINYLPRWSAFSCCAGTCKAQTAS